MAFALAGSLLPYGAPVEQHVIITNSTTRTVMDSVQVTSGFVAAGTAGALVFGHIFALETNKMVGLTTSGAAGADIGSYVNAFTTASNNQTVAMVRAVVDISKFTTYTNPTSGTIGTTTGSNLLGYHTDLSNTTTIDETSAITGTAQYTIWGLSPTNSSLGVYTIYESQVYGV